MAITVDNDYTSDARAIERDPVELVFDVDGGTAVSTTQVALATLPAGTIVSRVQVQCTQAHAGSGSATFNLKQGTTLFFTGVTDNGGTIGKTDSAQIGGGGVLTPTAFPLSADTVINAEVINTSTTTTAAKARITICAFRPTF